MACVHAPAPRALNPTTPRPKTLLQNRPNRGPTDPRGGARARGWTASNPHRAWRQTPTPGGRRPRRRPLRSRRRKRRWANPSPERRNSPPGGALVDKRPKCSNSTARSRPGLHSPTPLRTPPTLWRRRAPPPRSWQCSPRHRGNSHPRTSAPPGAPGRARGISRCRPGRRWRAAQTPQAPPPPSQCRRPWRRGRERRPRRRPGAASARSSASGASAACRAWSRRPRGEASATH
mmetsp:Transcript_34363/g.95924  ORF Transcript_34363/g.95924 Transcript_34363/m.95924 type:complete len:233 (-) Transcript_34363:229-927(-)